MYLTQTLDTDSGMFTMCRAVAGTTSMCEPRLHIGYRTVCTVAESPFEPAETNIRGYEFHYATAGIQTDSPAYRFGPDYTEGVADAALLASFLHRHFLPGSPAIGRFVARCAQ